jgi:hypothetical protein
MTGGHEAIGVGFGYHVPRKELVSVQGEGDGGRQRDV